VSALNSLLHVNASVAEGISIPQLASAPVVPLVIRGDWMVKPKDAGDILALTISSVFLPIRVSSKGMIGSQLGNESSTVPVETRRDSMIAGDFETTHVLIPADGAFEAVHLQSEKVMTDKLSEYVDPSMHILSAEVAGNCFFVLQIWNPIVFRLSSPDPMYHSSSRVNW
jgi:hypothetical protein